MAMNKIYVLAPLSLSAIATKTAPRMFSHTMHNLNMEGTYVTYTYII